MQKVPTQTAAISDLLSRPFSRLYHSIFCYSLTQTKVLFPVYSRNLSIFSLTLALKRSIKPETYAEISTVSSMSGVKSMA